jgi:hypothetical protein
MRSLIKDLIPNAPQIGLYVTPHIPEDKLKNALDDYAYMVAGKDVLALYDATLMGSAKDGAVFTQDGFIFQNNDLEPAHDIRYQDIVQADSKRKLLGGRRLLLTVNRGRATFELEMDFSGKPDAADYVLRFVREAMLRSESVSEDATPGDTDVEAVMAALEDLKARGLLASSDFEKMRGILFS